MKNSLVTGLLVLLFTFASCRNKEQAMPPRQPVDSVGFTTHTWQTDSVISRIERLQAEKLNEAQSRLENATPLRVALSPHDDYAYVGYLYPALFEHIRSKVVIMFGVGHKAKNFRLEDKIVFGSFKEWKSPAGTIRVSDLQQKIMSRLPLYQYIVHDSLQMVEHSLEALVPFLEHYDNGVSIIPIIVPYMSFDRITAIASSLSAAINETMKEEGLSWGSGYSIVISTDAVHYGNEDWGGKNYDRFGVDTTGYLKAFEFENKIVNETLAGMLTPEKIRSFSNYTVMESDYHEYKWTWCGRYSVPLGLLTAFDLSLITREPLSGITVGYSTSIENQPLPVSDIGMGVTAPAKLTHWVGYAAIGYR